MQIMGSFVEDTLPCVKREEGEINQENRGLDISNENRTKSNQNYEENDMEVAHTDLEELEDIHQYVMSKLAVELAPSHLLPPGWSTSSTSLLLPPPSITFYFRYIMFFLLLSLIYFIPSLTLPYAFHFYYFPILLATSVFSFIILLVPGFQPTRP